MHELPIMKDVLEVALEYAEANDVQRIKAISLAIGALAAIVPDWAQMFFDYVSEGTIAEGAKLRIETVPARIRCHYCRAETEMEIGKLLSACEKCGSKSIQLISGREFRILNMEVQ